MSEEKPIDIDLSKDITAQYLFTLHQHEDDVGLILKGHLLIEFILNEIINRCCKSPKTILRDHRSYTFAVKLQLVYSMGSLPTPIYKSIRRVNRLRNHLAHNLELEIDQSDFSFTRIDGKEILIKMKSKKPRYPARQYCKKLCLGTLVQLRNHFTLQFGELPVYSKIL